MRARRRALVLVMVAAVGLAATGCSKDEEVLAMTKEFDTFSGEIVKRVKTAPNPAAGVQAVQAYLDQNRAHLHDRIASLKEVRGFQISDATKKRVEASFTNNATAVASLEIDYVVPMATDAAFKTALEKLVKDYQSVVTD